MKIVLKASISFLFLSSLAFGDIVHTFKNPSFSGIGTGAHYLTIENQESSRTENRTLQFTIIAYL